jgi:hypothetical protein
VFFLIPVCHCIVGIAGGADRIGWCMVHPLCFFWGGGRSFIWLLEHILLLLGCIGFV